MPNTQQQLTQSNEGAASNCHHVGFLGYDNIQLLDLVGPLEALQIANTEVKSQQYRTFIVSENSQFTSESNIKVNSDFSFENAPRIDTLIIPGGSGCRDKALPAKDWVYRQFDQVERMVSVCTGIFLIADHDYLQNKEVVTHWGFVDKLQQMYPRLKVNRDRLFIKQGKFYSAAGVLSGIDLALNLIEEDHGADIAAYAAKYLVTYLKRSGFQSQFSEPLRFQSNNNDHLNRVNRWLDENMNQTTSVNQLALNVHISERHLNRLIKSNFHMSAAKYIEHIKLERSKIYLAKPATSIEKVSVNIGYASADAFRRSFKRKYGIAPQSYQKRFQS